jgi:hypothetical protein
VEAPQIAAWHTAHVTNGPTEAVNNLIKPSQAGCFRVHQLPELPDPVAPLRREAQLGPTRHHHTPVKSEEPVNPFGANSGQNSDESLG